MKNEGRPKSSLETYDPMVTTTQHLPEKKFMLAKSYTTQPGLKAFHSQGTWGRSIRHGRPIQLILIVS